MLCKKCNKPVDNDAVFCNFCGADIKTAGAKQTQKKISIGRGHDNDIILDFPQISWSHAFLVGEGKEWFIEDRNSTNHTYVNDRSLPISQQKITLEDTLYFGSYKISAKRLIGAKKESSLGCTDPHPIAIANTETVFGRDPSAAVCLDYPQVSWHHARLLRKGKEYILEDLGSTNGTYVNGRRIKAAPVTPVDTISFGSFVFRITEDNKIVKRDYRGDFRIDAENITVLVKDSKAGKTKALIEDVSLTIYPSEFVGLMGPSGAGKTTLMLAMNGYLSPATGFSKINGASLYQNYDAFRGNIGYVPQDDIIHSELTVYEALHYTALLRLPPDTTDANISAQIQRILSQLEITHIKDKTIGSAEKKGISGGQRKRVNLAMELLTDPGLLFLDEPTSGLSSVDTLVVMEVLRKLADNGKTIILTIHQPSLEAYKKMDNVIILAPAGSGDEKKGRLVYYGPAYPDSLTFFNPGKPAEAVIGNADSALTGLAGQPAEKWEELYKESHYCKTFIEERKTSGPVEGNADKKTQKHARPANSNQWLTLIRRYFTVKSKDRVNTAILLAQAPIIAALIAIVFHGNESPTTPLFLLIISALWFGASNSARELVAEKAIYLRERMVNLKIPSYIFSKYAVLSGLCLVQCITLVGIVHPAIELKGNFFLVLGVVFLSSLIGVSLGLFLSSITKTQQAAIALVPIILLPMVILGGGLKTVREMNTATFAISNVVPSRWAYEQILHIENAGREKSAAPQQNQTPSLDYVQQFYGDRRNDDIVIIAIMSGFIIGFIGITMALLKQRDAV